MNKLKILIAEDDKITRMRYERALEDPRIETQFVIDGDSALEVYREWRPDIMVLDIMLPVQSGYAVLKQIRESGDTRTIIVIATSMASVDDIKDCYVLGIQDYLVKPIDFAGLQQRILALWTAQHGAAAGGD